MNQYQDDHILPNFSLRDRAKNAMAGKLGLTVLAFFLVWLISMASSFLTDVLIDFILSIILTTREILTNHPSAVALMEQLSDPSYLDAYSTQIYLVSIFLSIGVSIVLCVFKIGLALFYLNLACGRNAAISDIFYGFRNNFGKSLKLAAVYTLVQEIFMVPFEIYSYLTTRDASFALNPALLTATICGLVLSTYLFLHISQCFFLLLDFPDYSAGKLLRLSSHIMRGHKKRLLLLILSFAPLFVISLFTFGIGLLWVSPYLGVTKTFFFLNLMQARDQNN